LISIIVTTPGEVQIFFTMLKMTLVNAWIVWLGLQEELGDVPKRNSQQSYFLFFFKGLIDRTVLKRKKERN